LFNIHFLISLLLLLFGDVFLQVFRAGGLGRLIGDEGSGYDIGMKAIKRSLEAEYGWGKPTLLLSRLKEHFQIPESGKLNQVIQPIHLGEIKPHEIAALSVFVFEGACGTGSRRIDAAEGRKGGDADSVCQEIVQEAAADLGHLLSHTLRLMSTTTTTTTTTTSRSSPWVYLVGGVFKHDEVDEFCGAMIERSPLRELPWKARPVFINLSKVNGLVVSVKRVLSAQQHHEQQHHKTPLLQPAAGHSRLPSVSQLLLSLPVSPEGIVELEEYEKVFDHRETKNIATEQYHPGTMNLSEVFDQEPIEGLKRMDAADESVLKGGEVFVERYLDDIGLAAFTALSSGGRLFLIGSGSSGRVAVDIAARWQEGNGEGVLFVCLFFVFCLFVFCFLIFVFCFLFFVFCFFLLLFPPFFAPSFSQSHSTFLWLICLLFLQFPFFQLLES